VPVPTFRVRLFQLGALRGEADFGEAQEDEAKDGRGVFLGLEAGVGAELVGGVPEAFLQRGVGGVLFGGGDPEHKPFFPCCLARQSILTGNEGKLERWN